MSSLKEKAVITGTVLGVFAAASVGANEITPLRDAIAKKIQGQRTLEPVGSPETKILVDTPKPSEAAGSADPEKRITINGISYTQEEFKNLIDKQVDSRLKELNPLGTPKIGVSPDVTTTVFLPKEPEISPAPKQGDKWLLQHPDQGGKTVVTALPEGFIPDKDLHMATDIKSLDVGDVNQYKDWEKALNTGRPVGDRLTGYNYDYNDFCNNVLPKFTCTAQGDMYAWRVFQGEKVVVPGIGELTGGPRRSVVVIVLNLDGSIHAWDPENPVQVKHGFTATGRIFDGDKAVKTEQGLLGHWLSRQFNGTPEKSYIGVTDDPNNAKETLFVTVQRKQWGLNADGSKRMEFQLIRAGIAQAGQPGPAGK